MWKKKIFYRFFYLRKLSLFSKRYVINECKIKGAFLQKQNNLKKSTWTEKLALKIAAIFVITFEKMFA